MPAQGVLRCASFSYYPDCPGFVHEDLERKVQHLFLFFDKLAENGVDTAVRGLRASCVYNGCLVARR
jgi:hypothetical protein